MSQDAAPAPVAPTEASSDDRLYIPEEGESQLTVRAVVAGCLLGGVVSAMNIYLGLRTGWSFGGSLISAILAYSLFAALPIGKGYSRLETNITQTAGSAAGSMTSAAGLLAPIPALGMLGYKFEMWELMLWSLSVAYLGVFFAVPLRRQMVVVEKLRFPTGTATANTILAMFADGAEAKQKANALLNCAVFASVWTLLTYFVPPMEHPEVHAGFLGLASMWGFSLLLSPMMFGAGLVMGFRVGVSLLLGAIASWAILGPYAMSEGWASGGATAAELAAMTDKEYGKLIMSYATGPRGWLLWPGVAIMVADALTRLAMSWRTILGAFTAKADDGSAVDHTTDPIPNSWWIGGLCISSVLTCVVALYLFEIPVYMTVLAIAMSSVLAMIAVRSTGETDINPIGGMGKVTQLVYGGVAPGMITTNLMAAAITGSGASQAGDMMQDLKTGYLLGASPRAQFKAQLVGIFAGVMFCVPIYTIFDAAYEMGGEELPAPAAHAWKAMAELLSKGPDALPPMAGYAIAGGLVFGAVMAILSTMLPKHIAKFVPSGLAFGIAFIVPAYYAVAMFIGSLALVVWEKTNASSAEKLVFAVASGLIAGEGLMGIGKALLTLAGVPTWV